MKTSRLFTVVLGVVLLLSGCTKYPLSLENKEFTAVSELYGDAGFRLLLESVLDEANGGYAQGDCAIIINDRSQLRNLYTDDLGELVWPEIDFSRYSLVVGKWMYTAGNQYMASQKIRLTGGSARLFLEIKESPGMGTCDVFYRWFGTLYPKLPDVSVVIDRKNNY